jgi:Ni/Co efflux regulator RcnB
MKRLILAVTAASLLFGTAAIAEPYRDHNAQYNDGRTTVTHVDRDHKTVTRVTYRKADFRRGARLPAEWRGGPDVNWRVYNLRRPPSGYHWVRAQDHFVLVAHTSGVILDLAVAR